MSRTKKTTSQNQSQNSRDRSQNNSRNRSENNSRNRSDNCKSSDSDDCTDESDSQDDAQQNGQSCRLNRGARNYGPSDTRWCR